MEFYTSNVRLFDFSIIDYKKVLKQKNIYHRVLKLTSNFCWESKVEDANSIISFNLEKPVPSLRVSLNVLMYNYFPYDLLILGCWMMFIFASILFRFEMDGQT